MFGREFYNHTEILMQSLKDMGHQYGEKNGSKKKHTLIVQLEKMYIKIFGIPEIGFQVRTNAFIEIISSYLSGKRPQTILDAGCGIGAYTFWLANIFPYARIVGGDIDKSKIDGSKIMKRELKTKHVLFVQFDITKRMQKAEYDLIVTIDVLEHVKNYEAGIINLYNLLNKNGYLYIHVPQPNQHRIFRSFTSWHHADHIREGISKKTLMYMLKKLGLRIIVTRETFGFFGKIAWEINHTMLSTNFVLAGLTFPFLYYIACLDRFQKPKDGLGIAILCQKV